jgi:hypothetical protein
MRGVAPGEAMNKLMISSGFLADAKWWRTGNVNVGEFYCILVFILFSLVFGGKLGKFEPQPSRKEQHRIQPVA